jgi:hypothetical protein
VSAPEKPERCPTCDCAHSGYFCSDMKRLHISCPDKWHEHEVKDAS